jgi:hypothetical protein
MLNLETEKVLVKVMSSCIHTVMSQYSGKLALVEIGALAPVANYHLHRFCNQCNTFRTKGPRF